MSWKRRLAESIHRRLRRGMISVAWFSVFHPRTSLILALVVTAFALHRASQLTLSTDIEDLLPRNFRAAQLIKGLLHRYGAAEPVVVAISGRGEADAEDRIELALALRDRLSQNPRLHNVTGLFGEDPLELLDSPLASGLLLYLTPEEIDEVVARVRPEAIERRVRENLEQLRSPFGPLVTRLIAEDPLGFSGLALRRLGVLRGRLNLTARDGVLLSDKDATYAVLMVRPEGPSGDVTLARQVVADIQEASRDALGALGLNGTVGIGPPPPGAAPDDVHVGVTGAAAILINYRDMLARDAGKISIVSYVAQLILFMWAFRRAGALLVAGTSMLVGVIWALGFAQLTIGEINIFTAGSIGILCGLTVDFSVHIYNRYLEEIHNGRDMLKAFSASHGETGIGILASVGVMVWAFAAAGFSEFRGLKHLAVICGAGLALSLLACLVMVPAMTALAVRVRRRRDPPGGMADFGLSRLLNVVVERPWTTLAIGGATTILLAIPALSMRLDDDVSKLRPQRAPAMLLQDDLISRTGASLQPVLALIPGRDDQEILERSSRVADELQVEAREERGCLAAVLGPSQVIPPPSRQQKSLERLRALRAAGVIDPAAVERNLLAALARAGFALEDREGRPGPARRAAARVREALARDSLLTVAEVRRSPLGVAIDDLIVTNANGQRLGIVSVYPRPRVSSNVIVPALRAGVERSGVAAELVGARILSQEIRPLILKDGLTASLIAGAGMFLILLFAFRRLVLVALTAVPLVAGMATAVGLMALVNSLRPHLVAAAPQVAGALGLSAAAGARLAELAGGLQLEFNLITISMLPLVFGIAIDNGIHVVHRRQEGVDQDVADVLRHVGRGVVMASLTTIVGFGALLSADFSGLRSSGVLAMLATGLTMIAALTLLPALLVLYERRRGRSARGGGQDAD